MFIATVKNRKSPPAILLRESYREGGKVRSRTLANLTALPAHALEALRRALKGEALVSAEDKSISISRSVQHGQAQAVLDVMRQLGIAELLHSRSCPERDAVMAMIAARVIEPHTKLATTRWWHNTTLPSLLGVTDVDEDDLYKAMDWLLKGQKRIEKKLAARHLKNDALALYDLTSSYVEGTHCPLAAFGYNRDGKRGKQQINYGLLTNGAGVPVSVSVVAGNVSDSKTVMMQAEKLLEHFALDRVVLVGDRGMITQAQIDKLQMLDGMDWISALRPEPIRKLLENKAIQMSLFDQHNLFSFTHEDFPGERLIACRNPALAELRCHKRQSLLKATVKELTRIKGMVERARLHGQDKIGVRVGKVVNKYKVAKHFILDIEQDCFCFEIDQESVVAEAALDGLYIIRTSVEKEKLDDDEAVRNYKSLSQVERAFRTFKSLDLQVRPIHHRLEGRVKSHIFLCMLAYYVQWHMREAWRPLLFSDEDQQAKTSRDPVAPAQRSAQAQQKVHSHTLEDGTPAHSFRTLLRELGGIVRNTCHIGDIETTPGFDVTTTPNALQQRALDLLKEIKM